MGEYLYLGSAILSVANGAVVLWINPRRPVNQVFFISCIFISLWSLSVALAIREGSKDSIDLDRLLFWLRASSAIGAFLCWLLWLAKAALTEPSAKSTDLLKRSWIWLIASTAIASIAFTESFLPSYTTPANKERGVGYSIYSIAIFMGCAWFLYDSLRLGRKYSGIKKIELRYFVVNSALACLVIIVAHAISWYAEVRWLRRTSLISLPLIHSAAIWAICHYRVFNATQLGISYGQRIILLVASALIAFFSWRLLTQAFPNGIAVALAAVFASAVSIWVDTPMRRLVGLDQEQILKEPRKRLIDLARDTHNEEQLRAIYSIVFRELCQAERAVFIHPRSQRTEDCEQYSSLSKEGLSVISREGWATPESLERLKPQSGSEEVARFLVQNHFGAIVAAPRGRFPPSLIIGFGTKGSLRPYTYPDIQLLQNLADLADNILAHSRAAESAAQAEKMAAAAMISRGLAHDLNNLATPVSLFLAHMSGRVAPHSVEAQVLGDAKHALGVMQDYIRETLFYSKILELRHGTIDVRQLLNSVLRLGIERGRSAGISVAVRASVDIRYVADFAMMQRLIQNLVFNAIDASPPKGVVEISAEKGMGGQMVISVSDQGPGVPAELRDKIFEPYFTTKDTGSTKRGLGLGLAICRKIVELHHGEIVVKQNTPRGSVFVVIIPPLPAHSLTLREGESADTSKPRTHEVIEASPLR